MRELIITGATIHPDATATTVEAVLVRDGRVVAVGLEADCRRQATQAAEIVHLPGRTVLPGFVDAHCHPLMHGQFLSWVPCDWESTRTIDDIVAALSARAAETDGPVRGRGFHHGNVAEQRMLTRHDLDRVATDREVMVFHSSGHGAIVNSWALTARGIGTSTQDPEGGHFGREADGAPDGSLWDAAADWLTGDAGVKITNNGPNFHIPDHDEELDRQLDAAQEHLLSLGITTVVDAQVTSRELTNYLRAKRSGRLRLRAELLVLSSLLDELERIGLSDRLGDERLAIAGVKLYSDGALTAATARWSEPYCCSPDDFGYLYHPNGELEQMLERVTRLGLVAATHAQGDAAIELVLQAFEQLGAPLPGRHRIEHFGGPTPEQVHRTAKLGLWPIPQPQYLLHYGDELRRALGDRADRAYPLGEMRDAGLPLALSSDAPVCQPGPLEAVSAAVLRRTLGGDILGDGAQRLSVEEALVAHTAGAAASISREGDVGSLTVGKHADFVVLDADPYTVDPSELTQIRVEETWVGGERSYVRS